MADNTGLDKARICVATSSTTFPVSDVAFEPILTSVVPPPSALATRSKIAVSGKGVQMRTADEWSLAIV